MALTNGSTSPRNLQEVNKMRKLQDARRDWENRHCSNSPFRIGNYGSSSSIGFDSCDGSPMTVTRGYGLRSIIQKGDQYFAMQNHNPVNITNKNSSFFKKNASNGKSSMGASNSPISGAQGSTLMSQGSSESLSPRPCSVEDEILEGFGNQAHQQEDPDDTFMEGPCYLKTKTDRFKEHWAVLNGNEIYCYRHSQDTKSRVMHCLAGTFVKEIAEEECPETKRMLFPVKIVLPPNKSRILYFDTVDKQKAWMGQLLKAMGFANLFDFYDLGKTLGKGQFGMVKLATHKVSGGHAAIKTVKKANMKPIEVF